MLSKRLIVGGACAVMVLGTAAFAQDEIVSGDTVEPRRAPGHERAEGREGHRSPPLQDIIAEFDANGDGKLQQSEAPDHFPARAFDHLDVNGDGAIDLSEAERAPKMRGDRERGDRGRGDRSVVRGERGDRTRPEHNGRPPRDDDQRQRRGSLRADFGAIIERFDLNGDGLLQSDEAPDRMMRMFARLDRNNDGTLDSREAENLQGPPRGPDRRDARRGDQGPERIRRGDPGDHPIRTEGRERRSREGRPKMSRIITILDENDDGLLQESEIPDHMQELFRRIDQNDDGVIDQAEAEASDSRRQTRERGERPRRGERENRERQPDSTPAQ